MARPKENKTCNRCGKSPLHWGLAQTPDGKAKPVLCNPETPNVPHWDGWPDVRYCPGNAEAKPQPAQETPQTTGDSIPSASAELWKLVKPAAMAELGNLSATKQIIHKIIVSKPETGEDFEIAGVHSQVPKLIKRINAIRTFHQKQNRRVGMAIKLVGPAGTGKTEAAKAAADALNMRFYPVQVGPQTSKADLYGFMSASGQYIRTPFRDAFEHGGLLLMDELDAGNPGVLTGINAILANTFCGFPDGVIEKHPDFFCIAACNTFGNGADRLYVGRLQLDAATSDRFVDYVWDYDHAIEHAIATENPGWVQRVHALRDAAAKLKLRVVISTRAVVSGCAYLAGGMSIRETLDECIRKGMSSDDWDKLMANVPAEHR